jgi:CobQ/CobB/MinD/ParA nucleotide binding domain
MRTIAFLTQKGGAGKTTLAASLAAVAVNAGERVIALDLDPQASLLRWGQYRQAANAPNKVVIEPIESERLSHLHAILEGLADVGFTLAIFDRRLRQCRCSLGNRGGGHLPSANTANAFRRGRDGCNLSSRLFGKAQSCLCP